MIIINKKLLILLIVIIFSSITVINAFSSSNQDFDGLFTMDIPTGQHYSDVAYCKPNGELGSVKEYWEDNSNCEIDKNEIVIYYYDSSLLVECESNTWEHVINNLMGSYLYKFYQKDGNKLILTNDLGMRNVPKYVVGLTNDDGSEVVFVGGYDLNNLKQYVNSIRFE